MSSVDAVVTSLLPFPGRGRSDDGGEEDEAGLQLRSATRLDAGVFHLDYGEEDQVFVLTVRSIPRRALGPAQPVPVGRIAGLLVHLSAVIIDNWVHLHFDAPDSPLRDSLIREHEAAFRQWAQDQARHPEASAPPPPWPGEQLLAITIALTDDLGTTYQYDRAQSGGSGTEWLSVQSFSPAPPAEARQLRVRMQIPGQEAVTTDVAL